MAGLSRYKLRKFFRSESGISAVEFALIAPVMVIIYLGCIELSMTMTVDRKVTGATAALGDLTARASNITNDDLSDIFQATRMIMQPNDISNASMRITSLENDGTDTDSSGTTSTVVVWSDRCGTGMPALAADAVVEVPDDLIPVNGTLIMAEIQFPYTSPLEFSFTNKTLTDKFYLRPRRVDSITRDTATGTLTCS